MADIPTEDAARFVSPAWYQDALPQTAECCSAGQEQPMDWDAAKRERLKRVE